MKPISTEHAIQNDLIAEDLKLNEPTKNYVVHKTLPENRNVEKFKSVSFFYCLSFIEDSSFH